MDDVIEKYFDLNYSIIGNNLIIDINGSFMEASRFLEYTYKIFSYGLLTTRLIIDDWIYSKNPQFEIHKYWDVLTIDLIVECESGDSGKTFLFQYASRGKISY